LTGGAESPHSIQNFGVRRFDCALIPAARRRININAKVETGVYKGMPEIKGKT
jgi:hypothetical protein